MRTLPQLFAALLVAASVLCSCDEEKKEVIAGKTDPETTPTMTTTDVATLISDSGITRYKITTPVWYVFDEAREPRWTFPKSLHLEKFDEKFKPEATIDCDSATLFKDKQQWRLDGYVNIRNTLGEKFLTNQLFWNQREQKIYSDSFIHIEKEGRVIEGYGFESNEQMTRYNVLRVAAIFPASQFKTDTTRAVPARPDSTQPPNPPTPPTPPASPNHPTPPPPTNLRPRALKNKPITESNAPVRTERLEKTALKDQSTPRRPGNQPPKK